METETELERQYGNSQKACLRTGQRVCELLKAIEQLGGFPSITPELRREFDDVWYKRGRAIQREQKLRLKLAKVQGWYT